jgi:hypothetical protein
MYKWLIPVLIPAALMAQHEEHDHSKMMADMDMTPDAPDAGTYLMRLTSGTGMNPESWPMPMMMRSAGAWHLMFMGQAFVVDTQQSGPRGGDKFYSTNWGMATAQRHVGRGVFMIQAMLSLEPATITERRYPLLFQTGETAFGRPLVDAQHPHDFVMGLGVHYARPVGEQTMLDLYYAPVGDPALGPVAFPHRASAFEIPEATLGHHWQDSTHIAYNVATVAVMRRWLRLEASGFHGREPDENRWNIDWGSMDSYSGRISVFPARNLMAQVSAGRLADPEGAAGDHSDVLRTTASAHYTRPMAAGTAWSTSLIWGRNHDTATHHDTDSYLLESAYPIGMRNWVTGRVEIVQKDELIPETVRINAFTAGYTREIGRFSHVAMGLGANLTAYAIPREIQPLYGDHPWGATVFLRVRLK